MIGAVDIGGTKIAAGIVNDAGKVLAKRETPTEKARSYRDGLSHIVRMLGEAAEQADTELSGIGIGSTGWVYPFTGEFGDVDLDRKSTRLNSSHQIISYAVFCLKKKK